jgi:hypothetical protein
MLSRRGDRVGSGVLLETGGTNVGGEMSKLLLLLLLLFTVLSFAFFFFPILSFHLSVELGAADNFDSFSPIYFIILSVGQKKKLIP